MASTAIGRLCIRVLTAAASPWHALSERFRNASLLLELYLWEIRVEDEIYLELIGFYNEISEFRSLIFVRQPRSLTGHLSGLCTLRCIQAAIPIIEERLAVYAERCTQVLNARCRSPYLPWPKTIKTIILSVLRGF